MSQNWLKMEKVAENQRLWRRERDKYFCIISLNININRYQKYLIFNFLLIYFEMILFD
jgi:hypothetical protein